MLETLQMIALFILSVLVPMGAIGFAVAGAIIGMLVALGDHERERREAHNERPFNPNKIIK